METKKLSLTPETWQSFTTGSGIVTAQAQGGFALVYIGDSAPSGLDVPAFTLTQGKVETLSPKATAFARGNATLVYVEVPE